MYKHRENYLFIYLFIYCHVIAYAKTANGSIENVS